MFGAGTAEVHIHIANGIASSSEVGLAKTDVAVAPVRIVAARQDLHLDGDGHVVSVLFNRPLPPTSADLSTRFDTDVTLDPAKFSATFTGKRKVAGAALQQDGRIVRLNYDSSLSADALYTIHTTGLADPASPQQVVPVIENRNSALILGSVIGGDNKPIPGADLILKTETGMQYQTADSNARFLFEYVPRDPENRINGTYTLTANASGRETMVEGTVRLLHTIHPVNMAFLGRGTARGHVRYDNGDPVANALVVIGSTMFNQFRSATTDATGLFQVNDVPVGPLTFSAQDVAGNVAYAANELHGGGEVVVQDVSIFRRPFPGTGNVRGRIIRSDTREPLAATHVGVYSQGYGLRDGVTDGAGRFEFTKVPSGFVTVLAENYQVAPQSIAVDFDLKPDASFDVGDLVLNVRSGEERVAVEGSVSIEDPLRPGVFEAVSGAQVQIEGMPPVSTDAAGRYAYTSVPQSFSGNRIRAYDPKTGRVGMSNLPTLSASATNNVPISITNASGSGTGTIRVHLLGPTGEPVSGYHVFEPGFPTLDATPAGAGVYELKDIKVGRNLSIVAAPFGELDATYGYQFTSGSAGVSFAGQVAAITLRLPGQGTVRARIQQQTESGAVIQVKGKIHATFSVWSDREQSTFPRTVEQSADVNADAVFPNVPALQDVFLETFESDGYNSTTARVSFNGDTPSRTLFLSSLSFASGRVLAIDGYTPVAGASVRMSDCRGDRGAVPTGLDGTFTFRDIPKNCGFTLIAEYSQNGIYRAARTFGSMGPSGPATGLTLTLQRQGSVEGRIVDDAGHPIPFARYWLRELDFPSRQLGTGGDPFIADANGHFRLNNVFVGPVRLTAQDPINLELRGDWNGAIASEGDVETPTITIGSAGTGKVTITVLDPNAAFTPVPNAEVSFYRNGSLFDFATTSADGRITFDRVPVGTDFTASAYSKSLGKIGYSGFFNIYRNQESTITITLIFSGQVNGKLTDPESLDLPVPGANVTLFGTGYSTRASTQTDGTFEFRGVREGLVRLEARDPLTIRMARNNGIVDPANATAYIPLQLEPTSQLVVKAYLPDDSGGNSGALAPLVSIDVEEFAPGGHYLRTSQVNGNGFPGLVRGVGISVTVQELGGRNRFMRQNSGFGANEKTKEVSFVFPGSGSVTVNVQQGNPPAPAPNVLVSAWSRGVSASAYTGAGGNVTLSNLPLSTVSIQASTLGVSPLTGATSTELNSQSHPATAQILLGSYRGISGYVEAEAGGASAGTRVIASYNGITLETRTDSTGTYSFQGIVTGISGVSASIYYLGPDDQTQGAAQSVFVANGSGDVRAPNIKLDSTPPHLVSIFPKDGSAKVAPDSQIKVTFTRAMNIAQLGGGYVRLFDVGTGAQVHLTLIDAPVQADNSQIATFKAPAPTPPQNFPLQSNTLYRVEVLGSIQDLAGHQLGVTVGASFTTSDYSNPQVTSVLPKPNRALPKDGFRLAVTFSKPLAAAAWQSGGNGVMQLVKLDPSGNPTGAPVPGSVQLDPTDNGTLYFAPNALLDRLSRYRLSIQGATDIEGRGVVDAAGLPLAVWTQDFSSYDDVAPVVTIGRPLLRGVEIGANEALLAGVLYTIPVTLANPDGSAVTDLKDVEFFSVDANGSATSITSGTALNVGVTPFPGTTAFRLRIVATDLSENHSTPATQTWDVQAIPPVVIASTAITPATVYAGQRFTDTVIVSGGFIDATVIATAYVDDGAVANKTTTLSRATANAPWPTAALTLQLPVSTLANAHVVVTTSVSDARGGVSKNDSVTLAVDTIAPLLDPLAIEVVRSSTPSNTTAFHNTDQYRVHAFARDGETGVASVIFNIGGQTSVVSSGTYRAGTGFTEFVSPLVTVVSHNNDATVSISAEAADFGANKVTGGTSLTYLGIHDLNAPTAAWISPLHDAAWPASTNNFKTRLSVYAKSNLPLTVRFDVGTSTFPGAANGTQYDADITYTTGAAGPLNVTAHIDDGDGGHVIDLPIGIDLVTITQTPISVGTVAVDATHPLTGDSILVDGARLVFHVPYTLRNLIVINGGLVDSVPSTTNNDQRVSLTVSDHFFVDGRSSVNVSERGYLGGRQYNFDATGRNEDVHGMTLGRTVVGGALAASASHAGVGGEEPGYSTNPTYGSIKSPSDLGSGGGSDGGDVRGGQGGGAFTLNATGGMGKVVVAGSIAADAETGVTIKGAGSGGTVHLAGKTVVLGFASSITANGGDDEGADGVPRGGGGGRISIEASSQLDIDVSNGTRLSARGGRNLAGDSPTVVDGGAGTIFLRYPGEANGELLVDPGFATSQHQARATVVAGTQAFDRVTVAPRGLVRFDGNVTVGTATNDRTAMSIDATGRVALANDPPAIAVTTTPAAGASIKQNTPLAVTYNATSNNGIGSVTATLDPSLTTQADGYPAYTSTASATATLTVPPTAVAGSTASLSVRAIDRAGRIVVSAPQTFTIAANNAPEIRAFDVTAPSPLYVGGNINTSITATDDVAVTSLALTSQLGGGAPSTQTKTFSSTPASTSFQVRIPSDKTLDGKTVTLTAGAGDGFPNRTTTIVKTLTIDHDGIAPTVTIVQPASGATFGEGSGNVIRVVATAVDAESGLASITATIEGGATVTLAATGQPNELAANMLVPNVPDGSDLTRTITVTALDVVGNSRSASVPVTIHPLFDPTAPLVTWTCSTDGAMFPVGYPAMLIATVVPGSTGTPVDSVTFSDGTTTVTASKSGTTYTATYTIPAVADGTKLTITATASSIGGGTAKLSGTFTAVVPDKTISQNTTINDGDRAYDFQNVVVTGGEVTILGHHDFKKLVVLGGYLTHTAVASLTTASIDIKADAVYVGCDGSINVTGRGFGDTQTYDGAIVPYASVGGSHIGSGTSAQTGSTFGSVQHPREAGGGAYSGAAGGGIVHISAADVTLDGWIDARGAAGTRAGAGGSIWIETGVIHGAGALVVHGGASTYESGGGGAISVEYTDPRSQVPSIGLRGGFSGNGLVNGGSGSLFVKGPTSTFGELTLDSVGFNDDWTDLPSLGTGFAQAGSAGATLVTDHAATIPPYFAGHWVEITNSAGVLKGTWRVATINNKSVTLAPNGSESVNIQPGDKWQGVYRFDAVHALNGEKLRSGDPIRVGANGIVNLDGPTGPGQYLTLTSPIVGTDVSVSGHVRVSSIMATNLTVKPDSTLTAPSELALDISGALTVDGTIDVSGGGYAAGTSYPGALGPYNSVGGSHIGVGSASSNSTAAGLTFGSIYHPRELGGGAFASAGGGGALRIKAGQFAFNGRIRANGADSTDKGGGGGSVWITAAKIAGSGAIEARGGGRTDAGGGNAQYEVGGGGAVSIEYTDATSQLPSVLIRGGLSIQRHPGGSGSLYVRGPASTYGELTLDNGGFANAELTELPSLGGGIAQSGSAGATLVTDRPAAIPPYFESHWVEISTAAGALKGTWRIATINSKTVTLAPNGNESINVLAGDRWQGVYRFDTLHTPHTESLRSADPIRLGVNGVVKLDGPLDLPNAASGTDVTVTGTVTIPAITSGTLTVKSGGVLTSSSWPLILSVTGTATIESGASIDVSGRGYAAGTSYPGAQTPGNSSGGSHLGVGGLMSGPTGETFGSVERPREAGGGSSNLPGGGVVQLTASTVVNNGSIRADGAANTGSGAGGAGGSIWITAATLSGSGSVSASGLLTQYGSGGGGAISIVTSSATVPWSIAATTQDSFQERRGGAGTVLIKSATSTFGDLTVDNGGFSGQPTILPSLGSGPAQTGSTGAMLVTARATAIPQSFAGHWVEISNAAGTVKGLWRIATINSKTVTLAPNSSESIDVLPGDAWQGVYRFDQTVVRGGGSLSSLDPIYANGNTPPVFDPALRAQIAVGSTPGGDFITGPAGAVTDSNPPIRLTATSSHATTFIANANADGSFSVPVSGPLGETFTLFATDSAPLPLSSKSIAVNGQLTNVNPVSAVAVQPSVVTPGSTFSLIVQTAGVARTGGTPISLTSSNPATIAVPSAVVVPAGSSSATLTLTAPASIASSTSVTFTAASSGVSKSAAVTVVPASSALASVTIAPNATAGGATATGTVTLGAPAPVGGATVVLSSTNNHVAAVPSSVLVPAGATMATFNVRALQKGSAGIIGTFVVTRSTSFDVSDCGAIGTISAPSIASLTTWFDDDVPSGATQSGSGAFVMTQAASGSKSIHLAGSGEQTFAFAGGSTLTVAASDSFVFYALINPCNPPRQLRVTWSEGSSNYHASWGEDLIDVASEPVRIGPMLSGGAWLRVEVPARVVGASGSIHNLAIKTYGGEAWFDRFGASGCSLSRVAAPPIDPNETLWFDEEPPAGAKAVEYDDVTPWRFDTRQSVSGATALFMPAVAGLHQDYFDITPAATPMALTRGDVIFAYVLIDPCNPPRQLALQFNDGGGWEHRAYWGEDIINWRRDVPSGHYRLGPMPEAGKWVRLEIPAALLGLDGVTVKGMAIDLYDGSAWLDRVGHFGRTNLALGKPVSESSQYDVGAPSRAVDGNRDGNWNNGSVTHTLNQLQPSWEVDLGAVQNIDDVQLWNRTDGGWGSRLTDYWVFVSDDRFQSLDLTSTRNQPGVSAYHYQTNAGTMTDVRVQRSGRFVRVQLNGTEVLSLAEVEVWGAEGTPRVNVAGGMHATESQQFQAYVAENAVNGEAQGYYNTLGGISHTQGSNGHWDVDLGDIRPISTVDVFLRTDCVEFNCMSYQWPYFYVFVSDQPFTSETVAGTVAQSGVGVWYHGSPQWPTLSIPVNRTGRYVRVARAVDDVVALNEVQVWIEPPTARPLVNLAAPAINTAKISVAGDAVVGTSGAVTDDDEPVRLSVTNDRTNVIVGAAAAPNGSFNMPVIGNVGDTFTITATDSNPSPRATTAAVPGSLTNPVTALALAPSTVTGGGASTATVTLLHAATAAVTVTLSSSNALATVPPTVTVAQDASTAQFTVSTSSTGTSTQATITATVGSSSQSANLTINPPALSVSSVALAPTSVPALTNSTATITLSAPAPAGGASVTLISSNASVATIPAMVVIPQGATSASVTITTLQQGTSTITATFGTSASAVLAVTACVLPTVPAPSSAPLDTVFVEDAAPAGAALSGGTFTSAQFASGSQSLNIPLTAGAHQAVISGATTPLAAGANDILVAYALVNPCNPPRQILFDWTDGTSDFRASWGEDLIDATTGRFRAGALPVAGQWVRLEVRAADIGAAGKSLRGLTIKVYDGEVFIDRIGTIACALGTAAKPTSTFGSADYVWFDDALPAGAATDAAEGEKINWSWDGSQSASGSQSVIVPNGSGMRSLVLRSGATPLQPKAGDVIVAYVLIDPCHAPRELMLWFHDGSTWDHAVYYGENLKVGGDDETPAHWRMGNVPEGGKWVRLEIPASLVDLEGKSVSTMELDVYDGAAWFDRVGLASRTNVALHKTAAQSSTFATPYDVAPDRAVDGNLGGAYVQNQITHTNNDIEAWWQLDLGSVQPIDAIEVWNRTDDSMDRLAQFWVFVSDQPFTSTSVTATRAQAGVSSMYFDKVCGRPTYYNVNRSGRYVRVQLAGTNYLSLAEVMVLAPSSPQRVNWAVGATASQSSTYLVNSAYRAVDGSTNMNYNTEGRVAHTQQEPQAWWSVDLGESLPIASVDLWNLKDVCCLARLTNFYLFASDDPFTSTDYAQTIAQPGVASYFFGSPGSYEYSFLINRSARYLRVQLTGNDYLHLAEVQAWSPPGLLPAALLATENSK
jgi:hypothetical protein